jgi:hypothetical protein
LFVPVNEGMFPFPALPIPIVEFVFVQLKAVPETPNADEKTTSVEEDPTQIPWLFIGSTCGVGLTVIVIFWLVPVQVTPKFVYVGCTVKVETMGTFVALVAMKDAIDP